MTVEEILFAPNSTDTTVIAMILSFLYIIVIEFAHPTEILPHIYPAVRADLRNWLLSVADHTNYPLNIVTADLVAISRGLVVAVAAVEDLVAAWGANLAPPSVVLASDPKLQIESMNEEEK